MKDTRPQTELLNIVAIRAKHVGQMCQILESSIRKDLQTPEEIKPHLTAYTTAMRSLLDALNDAAYNEQRV